MKINSFTCLLKLLPGVQLDIALSLDVVGLILEQLDHLGHDLLDGLELSFIDLALRPRGELEHSDHLLGGHVLHNVGGIGALEVVVVLV